MPLREREDDSILLQEEIASAHSITDSASIAGDRSSKALDPNLDLDPSSELEANEKDPVAIIRELQESSVVASSEAQSQDDKDLELQRSDSVQGVFTLLQYVLKKCVALAE